MKLLPIAAIAMTLAVATTGCKQNKTEHLASLNVAYMDTTVAPGADFYLSLIHI